MKNSEEAIDQILAGLRDAEAPAGMQRRILAAMQTRAAAHSPRVSWLAAYWPVVCSTAVACGVIALFALRFPHSQALAPATAQAIVPSHTPTLPVVSAPAPPAPAIFAPAPRRYTPAARAVTPTNILTASFPAPPMPLTEQERLLLQVARRGEPRAVPILDPDALAQQETLSEKVFEAFLAAAQEPSILNHKEDIR